MMRKSRKEEIWDMARRYYYYQNLHGKEKWDLEQVGVLILEPIEVRDILHGTGIIDEGVPVTHPVMQRIYNALDCAGFGYYPDESADDNGKCKSSFIVPFVTENLGFDLQSLVASFEARI
jgi:hypothetical protein